MDDLDIIIFADRYSGTYSKGNWVAACIAGLFDDPSLAGQVYEQANGGDGDAMAFWHDHVNAKWIAVGDTPDAALAALKIKAEAE